ncbi:MAG: hypothetical protein JXB47_20595 [Anaerolineae bacterium]|nr:hypothetical protein [Anaerolineae bacterium]
MTRVNIPPVMSVTIEDSMDIMIARDTARRAAGLLGFNTSCKAQLAAAVAALTEQMLKAGGEGSLHLNGVQSGSRLGIQISCEAGWLKNLPPNSADALQEQLNTMVDKVEIVEQDPPHMNLIFWLSGPRQIKEG